MQQLNITLEWFLNPDHLPMIAGIESKAYEQHGIQVTLIEPKEHYDGFAALEKGEIDLHINEPIHLFEHYQPNICSLGCFFETDGGVLMRADRMDKFHRHETIRICTPAAEPETNRIGFEILHRYAKQQGLTIQPEQVEFISAGFYHIDNLLQHHHFDGAWLCFYNFEAIEAQQKGLDFVFIDQHQSPYANFSALEFITSRQIWQDKQDLLKKFIQITNDMVSLCQQNPALAKQYYYQYSQTQADELMDAIIIDTLPRLVTPIYGDAQRWQNLRQMLADIDIIHLAESDYQNLWVNQKV